MSRSVLAAQSGAVRVRGRYAEQRTAKARPSWA